MCLITLWHQGPRLEGIFSPDTALGNNEGQKQTPLTCVHVNRFKSPREANNLLQLSSAHLGRTSLCFPQYRSTPCQSHSKNIDLVDIIHIRLPSGSLDDKKATFVVNVSPSFKYIVIVWC